MSNRRRQKGTVAFLQLAREAVDALWQQRQRSALALLGIVIGTGSVVAMLSIGRMAGEEALKPFSAMGLDILAVRPGNGLAGVPATRISPLPATTPGVLATAVFAAGQGPAGPDPMAPRTTVVAAPPSLIAMTGLRIARGRSLVDADRSSLVALVGADLAHPQRPDARPLNVGDQVRAGTYLFRVVGELAPAPQNELSPANFDTSIVIPIGDAERALGTSVSSGALIRIAPDADTAAVGNQIRVALGDDAAGGSFTIQSARDAVAAVRAQKAAHTRLLAAIASISLLVGGVGVMNIMLMSLLERRREIGLRAAIGARPQDIQIMFLAEAAVLSAIGGVAGAVLGVTAAMVTAVAAHWRFAVEMYSLPLGVGVAGATGLLFGVYPAVRASRLDPIEALRAD